MAVRSIWMRLYEIALSFCVHAASVLLVFLFPVAALSPAAGLAVLAAMVVLVFAMIVLDTLIEPLERLSRVRFSLRTLMGFVLALGFFAALVALPEPGWRVSGALGILGTLAAALGSALAFDPERRRGG